MIEELISRVSVAQEVARRQHFMTKGYAEHQALGQFYERVGEALDTLVEAYIGLYGDITSYDVETKPVKSVLGFLQEDLDWIEVNRAELCQGSDTIGNLVDGLAEVYAKTCFLLRLK